METAMKRSSLLSGLPICPVDVERLMSEEMAAIQTALAGAVGLFFLQATCTPNCVELIITISDGVHAVAEKNALEPNWLNYLTHLLMYDQIIIPRGKLWRRYGPLQIYIPPNHRPGRRLALRPSERNQHPRGLKVPGCHALRA